MTSRRRSTALTGRSGYLGSAGASATRPTRDTRPPVRAARRSLPAPPRTGRHRVRLPVGRGPTLSSDPGVSSQPSSPFWTPMTSPWTTSTGWAASTSAVAAGEVVPLVGDLEHDGSDVGRALAVAHRAGRFVDEHVASRRRPLEAATGARAAARGGGRRTQSPVRPTLSRVFRRYRPNPVVGVRTGRDHAPVAVTAPPRVAPARRRATRGRRRRREPPRRGRAPRAVLLRLRLASTTATPVWTARPHRRGRVTPANSRAVV